MKIRALILAAALVAGGSSPLASSAVRKCNGKKPDFVGTHGPDRLVKSRDSGDVFVALRGGDFVRSGGGPDTICAGRGSDTIRAGRGHDYIDAGFGRNDKVFCGRGNDVLVVREGFDLRNAKDCESILLK